MKILAFTDLHAGITAYKKLKEKIKKHKPDYIFCLGDFTIFEQNIEPVIQKISQLKKPVYILHGNHEMGNVVKKLCAKYSNLIYAHKKIIKLEDYKIVGHGGGGFYGQGKLRKDQEFEEFITKNKTKLKGQLILLTHAPPAHTKLDYLDWLEDHVGCPSYKSFIDKYKPVLALSGHIHETFGIKEKIGKTLISNPGPEGIIFKL